MINIVRKIIHLFFKQYLLFYIYGSGCRYNDDKEADSSIFVKEIVNMQDIILASDKKLHGFVDNLEDGMSCFGLWKDNDLVSVCWMWDEQVYRRRRNFWPLKKDEAKLVRMFTSNKFRGQGFAGKLVKFSCNAMFDKGIRKIFARIWHSNLASRKSLEKIGWEKVAFVLELKMHFVKKPFRFVYHFKRGNNKR